MSTVNLDFNVIQNIKNKYNTLLSYIDIFIDCILEYVTQHLIQQHNQPIKNLFKYIFGYKVLKIIIQIYFF